jgi:hypothetical protein
MGAWCKASCTTVRLHYTSVTNPDARRRYLARFDQQQLDAAAYAPASRCANGSSRLFVIRMEIAQGKGSRQ